MKIYFREMYGFVEGRVAGTHSEARLAQACCPGSSNEQFEPSGTVNGHRKALYRCHTQECARLNEMNRTKIELNQDPSDRNVLLWKQLHAFIFILVGIDYRIDYMLVLICIDY